MVNNIENNQPRAAANQAGARPKVVAPIPGWQGSVTSPFGQRSSPTGGGTEFHAGIDIGKPQGTPIQAAKDGKVVFAGDAGGYGNLVVLQHADGTYSLYAHQSAINVQVGQEVKAGDVVGKVGSTGRSTGPHLHFEVRSGGSDWNSAKPIDPVAFLNGAENQTPVDPGPGVSPAGSSNGGTPASSGDSNNVSGGTRGSNLGLPAPSGASGSSAAPSATRTIPAASASPGALAAKEQALADAIKADAEIQAALANWENLTPEQKLAIATKIAKLMGQIFGFDPQLNIQLDPSLGKDGTLGLTTPNGITLSRAALNDPKQFIDTLTHEETHVFDQQTSAGLAAPNHNSGEVEDGVYKVGHAVRDEVFAG